MALAIYKPGQGYWTRMLSVLGYGVITLSSVAWVWKLLEANRSDNRIYIQAAVAVVMLAVYGIVGFIAFNKPRFVDFFIATEAEMNKVNWPSRSDIIASTWIVICGTFLMAGLMLIIDVVFTLLFTKIGILEGL